MRPAAALAVLVGLWAAAIGCAGGTGEGRSPLTEERLRDAILLGVARDFRTGTGAGPRGYATCVRIGLRRALSRGRMLELLAVARGPYGRQFAAQALNRIAGPIGDRCGGRRFVPELIAASEALAGARLVESRAERLGLDYGPFVGVACAGAASVRCDRIGVELVLARPARAVVATVAGRRLRLITPGPVPHARGAAGRDWGGFVERAGLRRAGSPFYVRAYGRGSGHWAGSPPLYVPVRVAVVRRDGGRAVLDFPRVFVLPAFA